MNRIAEPGKLMQNRRYIYISGLMNNPVIKSQVLNWLEVLQQRGIVFDLMCCIPLHYLIMNWKSEHSELVSYSKVLQGNIYIVPVFRSKTKFNLISTLIKGLFLFRYSAIKKPGTDNVVIQTRSFFNLPALKLVKRLLKNTKVIYDMRGSASAEYLNSFGINSESDLKQHNQIKKLYSIVKSERDMIDFSDKTFCVSNNLKQYVLAYSKNIDADKLTVIPGGADKNVFFYDSQLSVKTRQKLGLSDKQVFVYCGRLTHYWHKSELIFQYASILLEKHPDMFFICLTKDISKANELMRINNIDLNRVLCKFSESPAEINEIYNAADFGILFRDEILTNKVSSPTKLAEYLLAGLPVLISKEVGDYSGLVSKFKFGIVTANDISELVSVSGAKFYEEIDRSEISDYAAKHLSKQAIVETIISEYSAL